MYRIGTRKGCGLYDRIEETVLVGSDRTVLGMLLCHVPVPVLYSIGSGIVVVVLVVDCWRVVVLFLFLLMGFLLAIVRVIV
jgi:hypothetical protein